MFIRTREGFASDVTGTTTSSGRYRMRGIVRHTGPMPAAPVRAHRPENRRACLPAADTEEARGHHHPSQEDDVPTRLVAARRLRPTRTVLTHRRPGSLVGADPALAALPVRAGRATLRRCGSIRH